MLIFRVGVTAIRSLVFPYSLWMIKDGVNGQASSRYARDFSSLLDKGYIIIRLLVSPPTRANVNPLSGRKAEPRFIEANNGLDQIKNGLHFHNVRSKYSIGDAMEKLRSMHELVTLYNITNAEVIRKLKEEKNDKNIEKEFAAVSSVLSEIF